MITGRIRPAHLAMNPAVAFRGAMNDGVLESQVADPAGNLHLRPAASRGGPPPFEERHTVDIQLRALAHTMLATFAGGVAGAKLVEMRNTWTDLPPREGETQGMRTDAIDATIDWLKAEGVLRKVEARSYDKLCMSVGGFAAMTKLTIKIGERGRINFTEDYANNTHTFHDFFRGVADGSLTMGDFVVPALLIKLVKEARVL